MRSYELLLGLDRGDGLGAQRHQLFGVDLGVVKAKARPPDAVGHERVVSKRAGVAGPQPRFNKDDDEVACRGFELGQVGLRLELGHDHLAHEPGSRAGALRYVVVVDGRLRWDFWQPQKAPVFFQEIA